MLNWGKNKAIIPLLLAAVLSLTGCGTPLSNGENGDVNSGANGDVNGGVVQSGNAPLEINYVVLNNLELTYEESDEWVPVEDSADGAETTEKKRLIECHMMQIDGLKDLEVEKKINNRIKEVFEEVKFRELPPYRGVRAKIADEADIASCNVYVYENASYNNMLSVMVQKYTQYARASDGIAVEDTQHLNFDLNTGDEIPLKALFADDVEGLELVHRALQNELSRSLPSDGDQDGPIPPLVKPIESISPDQQYRLRPNGISIVLDYRNPEVALSWFSSCDVQLDYMDLGHSMVHTKRFYNPEYSLFENEDAAKKELVGRDGDRQTTFRLVSENNMEATSRVYLPEEWPQSLKEKAVTLAKFDEEWLRQRSAELRADEHEGYEEAIYGDTMGGFYQLAHKIIYYQKSRYTEKNTMDVYSSKTLEKLELEDLFAADFDFRTMLLERVANALKIEKENLGSMYTGYEDAAEALDAMDFQLSYDSLNLSVREYANNMDGSSAWLYLYIPYEEIGYENITIFNGDTL